MIKIIQQLDKAFENRIRLGIMSTLIVSQSTDFNSLKELLAVSDGNLASHLKSLEEKKYLTVKKKFVNRKPNTSYQITSKGRKAFEEHLDALEKIINRK